MRWRWWRKPKLTAAEYRAFIDKAQVENERISREIDVLKRQREFNEYRLKVRAETDPLQGLRMALSCKVNDTNNLPALWPEMVAHMTFALVNVLEDK